MTDIPDAAIEAAAEALWGDFVEGEGEYPNFSDYAKKEQDYWRHDARVAIEAAMPAIEKGLREAIAQEIEAHAKRQRGQEGQVRVPVWNSGYNDGCSDAARIVRGAQ